MWQGLVDETSRAAPEDVRLLVHVASDVWEFVDEHSTIVADAYRQTERQMAWRRENRVRLLAAALLDGTSRIADLPEAAEALELPEHGRYVVVAVEGTRSMRLYGRPGGPRPGCACALAHRCGRRSRHRPRRGRPGGGRPGRAAARRAGGRQRHRRRTGRRGGGATAGGHGAAAVPGGGRHGTADRASAAAALVASSPDLAAALADRLLGPLAALEPADAEVLLDTLATWLACDGSAQRAARRLYCHRNTVLNRLRRYEQLTGRNLSRPTDLVETTLALTAHNLLHQES